MSSMDAVLSFVKRYRVYVAVGVMGLLLVIVSGLVWCLKVQMQPERVFWGTLNQSLATRGVSLQMQQKSGSASLSEVVQFSVGKGNNKARSATTILQGPNLVQTETLGTPTGDYVRYTKVKTDQKRKDGKPLNLSSILNVWAKNTAEPGVGHLFPQAALGVGVPVGSLPMPMGDLPAAERGKLIQQIRRDNVYQTTFSKVTKHREGGRLLYAYEVKTSPYTYVKMMQAFAHANGLKDLDQIDAGRYKNSKPLTSSFTIDARSHHLVKVQYNKNYSQTYTGYDVPVQIEIPQKAISATELQDRLGKLR